MTRDEARAAAAVMLDWADGAEIEFRNRDGSEFWSSCCGDPQWFWGKTDYRIKPKPLEGWVNVLRNPAGDEIHGGTLYISKATAARVAPDSIRQVLMREVRDE